MNREILFRAKSELTNKWVYGALYENFIIFTGNFDKEHPNEYANVYGNKIFYETVGQFTGLTDKNGNKIFEGDIVKCYRYANGKDGELVFENLVVVWDDMNACFALAEVGVGHISYRYNEYEMDDTHEFEVIGNIYDNPELLTDKT